MWSTRFFQISHLTLTGTGNPDVGWCWFDVGCRREKRHLTRLRRVTTGQQLKTATRSYLRFLRSNRRAYYTERICEVHHPERRWKLIKEASGLGRNPQRSVTPSPKDYSSYLNDKLRGICESTAGAPPPGFSTLIDLELNQLHPTSVDEVVMLIHSLPNKQCVIIEMTCCLKLRWESKVTPRSFRIVEEEGRVVLAMFIEDGGDRFLRCVGVLWISAGWVEERRNIQGIIIRKCNHWNCEYKIRIILQWIKNPTRISC